MRRIVSDLTSCATPGAYVSLACEVEGPYEKDRLDHALAASAAAHPLLRARVTVGDDGLPAFEVGHDPYVTVGEVAPIPLADLACTDAGAWDPLAGPLLRVTTCSSEDGFLLLLQAHDLLSDGPGLLSLMEGMVDAYVTGRGPEPGEDGGIMGASDLPDEAAPAWMAARTLAHANREWEAADGRLDLSDLSGYLEQATARHPVAHACQLLDVDGTSQLGERAEAAHARITSFVAAAASVAFEARKVDVGVDVRGDVASYVPGALGSFSSVVRVDATAGAGDLDARAWGIERALAAALASPARRLEALECLLALDPALALAVPAACLGLLRSPAASHAAHVLGYDKPALGVSDLGACRSAHIRQAVYVPSAGPACDRTVGVLTMNGRMSVAVTTHEPDWSAEDGRLAALSGLLVSESRLFPWSGSWKRLMG